jgi:hypothetical protein
VYAARVAEDYFERRPDATDDRVVGRIRMRAGRPAVPVPPPPGRGEPPAPADGAAALAQRLRAVERQRDELQAVVAGMLADPWRPGPDGRFCVLCGEVGEHADDCAVLRRDELLRRG